jgi:hypothetical protein
MPTTTITVIRDEDDLFFTWAAAGDGFFLNQGSAGKVVLHQADCPHFKGRFDPSATSNPKFLAADRRDLEQISPTAGPCRDCQL